MNNYLLFVANQVFDKSSLRQLLVKCSELFDQNERFALSDSVITTAIKKFQGSNTIQAVLPKVMLINSFYSTQIYDTEKIAKHILNTVSGRRLASGDLSLVDDMRCGHGIRAKKTGREIDFYSFATKYAALHEPTKYPLFDSLVMRLLTALNKQLRFCPHFTQSNLREYRRYVSVIDALLVYTGLESFKYKRLDQGLWVYAKYLYAQSNLMAKEVDSITTEVQRYGK
ncbi:MAG: hypothetical protein ABII79_10520 [bacterium]